MSRARKRLVEEVAKTNSEELKRRVDALPEVLTHTKGVALQVDKALLELAEAVHAYRAKPLEGQLLMSNPFRVI